MIWEKKNRQILCLQRDGLQNGRKTQMLQNKNKIKNISNFSKKEIYFYNIVPVLATFSIFDIFVLRHF